MTRPTTGKLVLLPTPLDENSHFDNLTVNYITNEIQNSGLENVKVIGEEIKTLRRFWLRSNLPREMVEDFLILNEHNQGDEKEYPLFINWLKEGKTLFLTSEGGLPAYYDPGQRLVDYCHRHHFKVTATPFHNSIALSIALSGFSHNRVMIEGFIPVKEKGERELILKSTLDKNYPSLLLDTPYRLQRLIGELFDIAKEKNSLKREIFLGIDLNLESEIVLRGTISFVREKIKDLGKREFVLIIGPKNE